MRFSFSIFLGFFLLTGFAAYLFFSTLMTELKPGFRQSTEESLVDVANLLAELAKEEFLEGDIADGRFAASVKAFRERKLNAAIWSLEKRHPGLSVYITDADGIVVYDSAGENLGRDFSQWNDVYLTLRGGYGARSTLAEPGNKFSSVMHVAAPILAGGEIVGALTV
ncbi:MAG: two-component system sensor histidine kinase CreC, partial [Gammaproteobacteria bacterium]